MAEADMGSLSAAAVLQVWESGRLQAPPRQAVTMLAAASSERSVGDIQNLSVGERDERLLALRERLFGPVLQCVCRCPQCGEELESEFYAADLRPSPRTSEPEFMLNRE